MGQKVNPVGMRLGISKTWRSNWYVSPREYAAILGEDLKLRRFFNSHPLTQGADIADIEIIRQSQDISLMVHTARPGVIIGTKGATIEKIGALLQKETGKKVQIKIKEIKRPDANAQIVAMNLARQLRTRTTFRRSLKMALSGAIKNGAQGIKIRVAGRLGGADMSRTVTVKEGRIPLHTFRADINYGFAESHTTFGSIGVKVWIFTGEKFHHDLKEDAGLLVRKRRGKKTEAQRN